MKKYDISAIVKKSRVDATDEEIEYAEEKIHLEDFIYFLKSFEDDIVEATIAISINKEEKDEKYI